MDNKTLEFIKLLNNTRNEKIDYTEGNNSYVRRDAKIAEKAIEELVESLREAMSENTTQASLEDPTEDGVAFDTLIDGEEDEEPVVQELTRDDGGFEEPREQELLIDDLPQ
jgi:hypothetical protein